jgi:hypothetical protein
MVPLNHQDPRKVIVCVAPTGGMARPVVVMINKGNS